MLRETITDPGRPLTIVPPFNCSPRPFDHILRPFNHSPAPLTIVPPFDHSLRPFNHSPRPFNPILSHKRASGCKLVHREELRVGLWSLLGGVSGLLHTLQAPLTRGPRLFLKGLLLVSSQTGVLAPSGSDADSGNVVLGARGVKGACCWSVARGTSGVDQKPSGRCYFGDCWHKTAARSALCFPARSGGLWFEPQQYLKSLN